MKSTLLGILLVISCWGFLTGASKIKGLIGRFRYVETRASPDPPANSHFFEQPLDHFSDQNTSTWKQLYYVNTTNYVQGGPAFLLINGESDAQLIYDYVPWFLLAEQVNAICFSLEHRFYGNSIPNNDLSTRNLKYLSSQQALADITNFIQGMNSAYNLGGDTKWIVFGGSYSGDLSAWARYKYPKWVHGSLSSSGPLTAQYNFGAYLRVTTESLATYSNQCVQATRDGFSQINNLLRTSDGQNYLNTRLNLCYPIQNSLNKWKDLANFFEALTGPYTNAVQYNGMVPISIKQVCDVMTNSSINSTADRVIAVHYLDKHPQCLNYHYDDLVRQYRNPSANSNYRQWTYQTCAEFGFFQTTDETDVFGKRIPIDYFSNLCADVFGPSFNSTQIQKNIRRTNSIYNGIYLNTNNTVFVYGSLDQWHALGRTTTLSRDAPSIYIRGGSHTQDMYTPFYNDPQQLKNARTEITALIKQWLKN